MRNNRSLLEAAVLLGLSLSFLSTVQAAGLSRVPQDPSGSWVGVYEYYPSLLQISLQLPKSDGSGKYSVSTEMRVAPLVEIRTINAPARGSVQVTVTYDALARTLSITPEASAYRTLGMQVPTLTGVLDEENQLVGGVLVGAGTDTSPYFILGRSDGADTRFLKSLIESVSPGRRASGIFGLNLGGAPNLNSMLEWVNRVHVEYPKFDPWNTALGGVFPLVRNLFRDEYFKPYFGERFDDMSGSELNRIAVSLRTLPLARDRSPSEKPAATLHALSNALIPPPAGFRVQDFKLSEIAMRAMTAWRTQSAKRIEAFGFSSDSWAPIAAAEAVEAKYFVAFFPSERTAFAATLASNRTRLAAPLLVKQVDDLLQAPMSYADVPKLTGALVDLKSSAPGSSPDPSIKTLSPYVPEEARQPLAAKLAARQMDLAVAEVRVEVGNAHGVEGLRQVLATGIFLREQFSVANNLSDAQQPLFVSLKQKVSALDAEQATAESRDYQVFAGRVTGLPAMLEAKQREARLQRDYAEQLKAPEFAAFNAERRAFRQQLIAQNSKTLGEAVLAAEDVPTINSLVEDHFVDGDENSAEAKPLMLIVQQRKAVLAPFADLPGGDYLDAIYGGNNAELHALDVNYLDTYTDIMGPFRAFMRKHSSLIGSVLTDYLLNYETAYGACLRPDAVSFEVSHQTVTQTQNGWGVIIATSYGYKTYTHFKVNREFAPAFDALGTNDPDSAAAFDIWLNHGKVANTLQGIKTMMARYPCSDPRIKRMEEHMLTLWQMNR